VPLPNIDVNLSIIKMTAFLDVHITQHAVMNISLNIKFPKLDLASIIMSVNRDSISESISFHGDLGEILCIARRRPLYTQAVQSLLRQNSKIELMPKPLAHFLFHPLLLSKDSYF
jgi:hypothetical protein